MKNLRHQISILMNSEVRDCIMINDRGVHPVLNNYVFNQTWDVIEESVGRSVHQNIRL